jgi:hypothetical protein
MALQQIARRGALSAATSAAIAASPIVIDAGIERGSPDPVVALGKAERAAWAEFTSTSAERDRREGRYRLISAPRLAIGRRECRAPEEVMQRGRELIDPAGSGMEIVESAAERLREDIAAYEKARNDTGITALQAAEAAAFTAWEGLVDKIIATPAQSFAGLAVKLLIVREDMEVAPSEMQEEMVASALADAARLGGAA